MTNPIPKLAHYYGDTVRFIFLIAAVTMLVSLPTFGEILNIPIIVSVVCILILGLAAGLTNPRQKWDAAINVTISAVGFLVFESVAAWTYQQNITTALAQRFFITNLGLGLLFLLSLYFSVKTLRGTLLNSNNEQSQN